MFSDNNSRPDISGHIFRSGANNTHHRLFVKHDKKFIPMEFIFLLAILLPSLLIFFFSYSTQLNNPVIRQKQFLLELAVSCMVISIILTVLVTFTCRKKHALITGFTIVTVLSIMAIALLLGLKMFMNKYFTPQAIAQYYDKTQNSIMDETNLNSKNTKANASSNEGLDLKATYITESSQSYTEYTYKLWAVVLLYLIYVFEMFYFIYRASQIEETHKNLGKNNKTVIEQKTEEKI